MLRLFVFFFFYLLHFQFLVSHNVEVAHVALFLSSEEGKV